MTVSELKSIQERECNRELGEKRFGSARAIIERLDLCKGDGASMADSALLRPNEKRCSASVSWQRNHRNVALACRFPAYGRRYLGDNNLNAGQILDLEPGVHELEYRVRLPISSGEYLVHCGLACFSGEGREELDQRRPVSHLRSGRPASRWAWCMRRSRCPGRNHRSMIAAFLLPFPLRGYRAPYLWVYYRLLSEMGERMLFITSEDYTGIRSTGGGKPLGVASHPTHCGCSTRCPLASAWMAMNTDFCPRTFSKDCWRKAVEIPSRLSDAC